MERMLDAPEREPIDPLDSHDGDGSRRQRVAWWQSLHATSTRRALLLTALGGLLIAGLITALPQQATAPDGLTASTISLRHRAATTRSTTPRAATA